MKKEEYKKMQWEDPKLHYFDRNKSTHGACTPGNSDAGCSNGVIPTVACADGGNKALPPPPG